MKVINLFAGPGAGKSVCRALVFAQLKMMNINVEETTEYAKDLTFEKHFNLLSDQLLVLANQNRKLERLREKVDFVVTDCPLLLSLHYKPIDYLPMTFQNLLFELWNTYDNINLFINRGPTYSTVGRNQTFEEAKLIDIQIKQLLNENNIKYISFNADKNISNNIVNYIKEFYL
jgi:hypothetical protein